MRYFAVAFTVQALLILALLALYLRPIFAVAHTLQP